MTSYEHFETSLRECWRRECGATAEERPNPSPSFRNIFRAGYEAGQHDKFGNSEQLLRLVAAISTMGFALDALRPQRIDNDNLKDFVQACIEMGDVVYDEMTDRIEAVVKILIAELNKTERQ